MDSSSFKISSNPIEGIGINIKDISPWTGSERDNFGFAVFLTVSGIVTADVHDYFFDEWTIEMIVSNTVKVEVYGLAKYDDATEYTIGEIVLSRKEGAWMFFKALGTSTDSDPQSNAADWLDLSTQSDAIIYAAFDALVSPDYYDEANEVVDEFKVTYEKTACYTYAFDLGGVTFNHYRLQTLEQFNNGTAPISEGDVAEDTLSFNLTEFTDSNGVAYGDGIYLYTLSNTAIISGIELNSAAHYQTFVLVDICKITECYKKIVMQVLCSKLCGCTDGCTDEEIAEDRKMRDFLNMYLASFSLVLGYLNKDYVAKINATGSNLTEEGELFSASTIISRLLEIVNNCKMCEDV